MVIGADQTPPRGDFVRYVDELLREQAARQAALGSPARLGSEDWGRASAQPSRAPAPVQSAPLEMSTPAGPPDLQELLARLGWNGRQLGWWMLALIVLLVVAGPLLAGPLIAGGVFWLVWRAVQSAKQLNARD